MINLKDNMPLIKALEKYINESPELFHMPGHKGGKGFPQDFKMHMAEMDLTEVPGLDNLYNPTGPIFDAQRLAAKAFNSDQCFFLVNGSTSGVQIMIHSAVGVNEKIIVPRNCHKSVWNALILTGAQPVYVQPEVDSELGLALQVSPAAVEKIIKKHPDIKAMILVHPNYYGVCSDILAIRKILSMHDVLLLVDEAHGAHFPFHPAMPISSCDAEADMWVQSAHKTLPALTQSAYLHMKGSRINENRLSIIHSLYQSTSPSYILMASLDYARSFMETRGKEKLDRLIHMLEPVKREAKELGIGLLTDYDTVNMYETDPTKLVLDVSPLGITGYQAEKKLRSLGVQVEMSDFRRVVFICTVADDPSSMDNLLKALRRLANNRYNYVDKPSKLSISWEIPKQEMTPKEAFDKSSEYIPLKEGKGRVSSGLVGLYPPGIPKYCPGEVLDQEGIDELLNCQASGGILFGVTKEGLISVVK